MSTADATPTPPCCPVWQLLAPAFSWFRPADADVDLLVMPTFEGRRVNYCPSCGADRRSVQERRTHIHELQRQRLGADRVCACGAPAAGPLSMVCAACRRAAYNEAARVKSAQKRAAQRKEREALPPAEREAAHRKEREAERARYRRRNPAPPCQTCGKPVAHARQAECDDCCPDLEARDAKRARERARSQARKGGAS